MASFASAPARFPRVLLLALLLVPALAFYLPGIAPTDYEEGTTLDIFADKVSSAKNRVPHDYYSLPFCKPAETASKKKSYQRDKKFTKHLNLGQILSGERFEPTAYEALMKIRDRCRIACSVKLTDDDFASLTDKIRDEYLVDMVLDNMPAVIPVNRDGATAYVKGFPIGAIEANETLLFNHLDITIRYHRPVPSAMGAYIPDSDGAPVFRVVAFEVIPRSYGQIYGERSEGCTIPENPQPLTLAAIKTSGGSVVYSYSVTYAESPVRWATRWDPILKADSESRRIQWFAIVNSTLITLFLTSIVGMILARTVYLDIAAYNSAADREELREESGWKLLAGDVYRAPPSPGLLAVLTGSGAQLLVCVLLTLIFALAGFMSPANRGGLLSALVTLWVASSLVGGFASGRLYANLHGENKRAVTLGTAFFFSGTAFAIFFILNLVMMLKKSSGTVPFLTLVLLLFMWFGVSLPLNVLGAFFAYKLAPYEPPTKVSSIPREIPKYSPIPTPLVCIFAGLLPFAVMFVELVFILNSIWQREVFYMFGFLFIVLILLCLTCVEVGIVTCYMMLTRGDYQWWWNSFASTASAGIYVFLYSFLYLFTQPAFTGMHASSYMVYFGYTFLISLACALVTGYVGFIASYWFVGKLFTSVHVD